MVLKIFFVIIGLFFGFFGGWASLLFGYAYMRKADILGPILMGTMYLSIGYGVCLGAAFLLRLIANKSFPVQDLYKLTCFPYLGIFIFSTIYFFITRA